MLVSAQQQDELRLLSSSNMITGMSNNAMFYRPVFEHKGSTLSADSGYLHKDEIGRQFFEAYSNVIITQPTGTQIFADKLHYEAASQNATLTQNVRMVSRSSVLTTNHLQYNMRSSIGNYYDGGRITSGTDTITSTNATYFENTQDAFFNKKVVVRSQNVKIYTDSMKYNSPSSMTYFFTPTNIQGNKGENLYTEKGDYNTTTGVANFTKKNLYTEGSKLLKGDTLHYDRRTGEGQAIHNVVFIDTTDKFYAYGNKGLYRQSDESITMTEKPLIISVVKKDNAPSDSTDTAIANTETKGAKEVKKKEKNDKKEKDEVVSTAENEARENKLVKLEPVDLPKDSVQMDSIFMTADTLFSKMILRSDYIPKDFKLSRDGGELDDEVDEDYGDDDSTGTVFTDGLDSLQFKKDSLGNKEIITEKPEKEIKNTTNTLKDKAAPETKKEKSNTNKAATKPVAKDLNRFELEKNSNADSLLRKNAVIPKADYSDQIFNKALRSAKNNDAESASPPDTAKTRIVKAYHSVRMFKSDFQAVADSVYYGMADSMFRLMGKPMIWAEKSQMTGDTIFLQFVNQKLDNTLILGNAFMVNSTLDSSKYNQLKGRKITGFFNKNSLERMFVDGNAENIIYVVNEVTNVATELFHDKSSRIKIFMENNKLKEYISVRKVDGKVYPVAQLTQEKEFLPGFIWKPEDRPKSKEDLLNRKRILTKEEVKAPGEENKDGKQKEKANSNVDSGTENKEPETENKEAGQKKKVNDNLDILVEDKTSEVDNKPAEPKDKDIKKVLPKTIESLEKINPLQKDSLKTEPIKKTEATLKESSKS
ncbi:OstA-like protein [Sphingobacterium sp. ML3W]|uniref:OstA-like protein n=1 Tax=Sphingobacterium sp. ML3W TaxID=1538644 RepID=UPI0009E0588A|nr:OstA-like protein [Sphingobacterium sp. ML3W]